MKKLKAIRVSITEEEYNALCHCVDICHSDYSDQLSKEAIKLLKHANKAMDKMGTMFFKQRTRGEK